MKSKMIPFFVLILLSFYTNLSSQENLIPDGLVLETEQDYTSSEGILINVIDYLQNTPVNENPEYRQELNAFFIKWLSGSPSVTVEVFEGLVPLDSPETMVAILAGWVKYSLENNYSDDKKACALAGITAGIDFYTKNRSHLSKNKFMKKMIKKSKNSTLETYIEEKLKY